MIDDMESGPPTCRQVLSACDAALSGKIRELELSDLGVKIRDEDRASLQKENAALREKGSVWYENPFLWAAIGVFVGSYAVRK